MFKNRYFRIKVLRVISAGFLIIFGTAFIGLKADAASFSHVHTEGCYHEEQGVCTNHHIWAADGSNVFHCSVCQQMQTFNMVVYWDVCDDGLVPNRDVAYVETCSVCGTRRRNESPGCPGSHTYTKKVLGCGFTEDSAAATISAGASSAEPTNSSVTITAKVNVNDPSFSLASAPFNFGEGWTAASSFEVTQNGTYPVSVQDSTGRVVTESVTVSCIDKDAPVISSVTKSTEAWTESGVTITVNASDEGLGLADAPFSFGDGEFGSSNTYQVKANGDITVKVRDKAGNVAQTTVKITNIGKDPAVVAAEKAAAEKAAAEKAAAEKAAAEKAAAEKAAADKARAAALQKQQEQKAQEEKASQKKSDSISEEAPEECLSEDVSENDVSENEAKLIIIQDITGNGEDSESSLETDFPGDLCEAYDETYDEAEQLRFVNASSGSLPLIIGGSLAVVGLLFISFFSYIYVSVNGKKKIICLCKIRKNPDGIIVLIPQNKLKNHGRFLISISFWKRKGTEKLPVKVLIEGEENTINTDEGVTFKY